MATRQKNARTTETERNMATDHSSAYEQGPTTSSILLEASTGSGGGGGGSGGGGGQS
jgi:hypothetical protein